MGLPLRLGLETLGVGAPHLTWGASPPLAAAPLGDPINPVLLNASALDLQGYVDALPSLSLLVSP